MKTFAEKYIDPVLLMPIHKREKAMIFQQSSIIFTPTYIAEIMRTDITTVRRYLGRDNRKR